MTEDEMKKAVGLAGRHVKYRGDWPTGDVTLFVADYDTVCHALLALHERCERMQRVAEAACRLFDRAEKCHDRPYMGCSMDHAAIESALYDEVTEYRALSTKPSDGEG